MDRLTQLMRAGKSREAVALIHQGLAKRPNDPTLLLALGQAHNRGTRDYGAALKALDKLLKTKPRLAAGHLEKAQVLSNMNDNARAVDHAKKATKLAPGSADTHYVLATLHHKTNHPAQALRAVDTALKLSPGHVPTRLLRANILRSAGQIDEAVAECRSIFADAPNNLHLFGIYANTTKLADDDPMMVHFRDVVLPAARAQAAPDALVAALRVMAKLHTDTGRHEEAIETQLKLKSLEKVPHDRKRMSGFVDAQIRGLSRADYFGGGGSESEQPVLIVGMPRSGSTLLEQILSSHPQVHGVGESAAFRLIVRDTGIPEGFGAELVNLTKSARAADLGKMAKRYLREIGEDAGGALRIVDKNLHNFEYLGLFARVFPKARILHATRDPLDCCVSCYMQNLGAWHSYTRDLGDLGHYYKDYKRLMAHWANVLPNPIMDVAYEEVVGDIEGTARKVIAFLGLDWDDACLNYQDVDNRVRTLSSWQVRQPIYKNSVKRWKRYDRFLEPLKSELRPLYPDGFE